MAQIYAEQDQLVAKAQEFESYAGQIISTLSKADNEIVTITQAGMAGTAIGTLVTTYQDIHDQVVAHAQRIMNLAEAMEQTAAQKTSIDADSEQKAKGVAN